MSVTVKNMVGVAMLLGIMVSAANASSVKLQETATITMPGTPLQNFDTGYVDQNSGLLFLADRSISAVDIINAVTGKYIGRVSGFAGFHGDNDTAGPSGLTGVDGQIWASDGNSSIKIIDPKSEKVVDVISVGGQDRSDEMTYDARDQIVGIENDSDVPPFLTLISTKPDHKILAQIKFPHATGGLDEPTFYPGTGMFYMSVPELDHVANQGAVAVVDPRTEKVVKMIPVDNCIPAGSAFGPNGNFVLGCRAGASDSKLPQLALVMNVDGSTVAKITQIGGVDTVAYNPNTEQYYLGSAALPSGAVLGIIDAATNSWVENIPTGGHAHAVAVSDADNRVFVPRPVTGGNCGTSGCIGVYEPVSNPQ